jgi:hypothetical protein
MSETPENQKEEIPAFRITEKKVDDSWKEEVRRERLATAKNAEPARPAPGASPAAGPQEPRTKDQTAESAPAPSTAAQQQSKIFVEFLAGLAQQALMQLGEIESPFTGQREVDLQGARYTIELLGILQAKTKGNLAAEEDAALKNVLRDLKMRYVEIANEVQRQMAAQAKAGPKRPGPGGMR